MKFLLVFTLAVIACSGLEALRLRDVVNSPEAYELDQVDNDLTDYFKGIASGLLDKLLTAKGAIFEGLEKALTKILEVIGIEKGHLGERFKAVLEKIKGAIDYEPLSKLVAKLIGSGNSTNTNGFISSEHEAVVEELLKQGIEEMTKPGELKRLRDYVERLAGKSKLEVVHALRELLHKLDDTKLKAVITTLLSGGRQDVNGFLDIFDHIKELFKTFGASLVTKFKPFVDWVVAKWADIKSKLSDKVGIVKAIAEELLGHGKTISKIVAEEAKTLLGRYKDALGALYQPLMKKLLGIEDKGMSTTAATF